MATNTDINKNVEIKSSLDAEQVSQYLLENGDFFLHNELLLGELNFLHESDNKNNTAISISQRQVEVLRHQNEALVKQLDELVANGKQNDYLFEQFQQFLIALSTATTLVQFVDIFNRQLEQIFNLNTCQFFFQSTNDVVATSLIDLSLDTTLKTVLAKKTRRNSVFCGRLNKEEKQQMIQAWQTASEEQIQSVAICALDGFQQEAFWVLGSDNEQHFNDELHTFFLQFSAGIIGALLKRLGIN